MEIISEPDWEVLIHNLLQNKGSALIIGATDSGKSTLAKYLVQKLVSQNITVCLIDSDVGQSSLGIPGTICMKVFSTQSDLKAFSYEKMSFIGTINPAKRISLIINTVKMISETCKKISNITLIDTSGLVAGELGEKLKIGKIRALNPNHIIAVQRQNELEHILSLISDIPIHRIIVSNNIKARPLATRIQYRKNKFNDYFRKSEMNDFILYSHDATFLYNSKAFSMREGLFQKNTVIGLNHNDDTIALGILEDISDNSITLSSPLSSIRNIDRIIFGDITYVPGQAPEAVILAWAGIHIISKLLKSHYWCHLEQSVGSQGLENARFFTTFRMTFPILLNFFTNLKGLKWNPALTEVTESFQDYECIESVLS